MIKRSQKNMPNMKYNAYPNEKAEKETEVHGGLAGWHFRLDLVNRF